MGPSGRCWVFSTREGIPYYRNLHVYEEEIALHCEAVVPY